MDYKQSKVVFHTQKHTGVQNGFQTYNCFHCFRSRNFQMCPFPILMLLLFAPSHCFLGFYQWQNHQSSFLRIKVEERTLHQHSSEYEPPQQEAQMGYAGKFLTLYLMNLACIFLFINCMLLHTDRLILVSFISNETLKHCI